MTLLEAIQWIQEESREKLDRDNVYITYRDLNIEIPHYILKSDSWGVAMDFSEMSVDKFDSIVKALGETE